MSCNPLLRWALLFWIAGLGAALLVPCLLGVPTRDLAWLCGLPCQDFQAIPASGPPVITKNSRQIHCAAAALPHKSS